MLQPGDNPSKWSAESIADSIAALVCATLADGDSEIRGIALAPDVECVLVGLTAVGVKLHLDHAELRVSITGAGGHVPLGEVRLATPQPLALAAMLATLAVSHGQFELDTQGEITAAELAAVSYPFVDLHAAISREQTDQAAVIFLTAAGLHAGQLIVQPATVPFLPAILPALPYAGGDVLVNLPAGPDCGSPPVRGALAIMHAFGVETLAEASRLIIPAPQRYRGTRVEIAR